MARPHERLDGGVSEVGVFGAGQDVAEGLEQGDELVSEVAAVQTGHLENNSGFKHLNDLTVK